CAIENLDPMGVHTGDSITVAPAQTLTDKEYQRMRDASLAILRAIGVETGGSNCQFAINPDDGEMVVVEMNPRVSRSSALASKATGFPIAKIAAKLAVGYTLDELPNDITGKTVACFEPSIDYVVTKLPRWTFEKFPEADETLTTQMKSVGEAMSIGRTFKESLQKGIRSMEVKRFGLGLDQNDKYLQNIRGVELADGSRVQWPIDADRLERKLRVPSQGRMYYVRYAFKMGWTIDEVFQATKIDPWFLDQLKQLVDFEAKLEAVGSLEDCPRDLLFAAKQLGYSDPQLANLFLGAITTTNIMAVRKHRKKLGIEPVYKLVDTCAAEFEAATPYYYSTYETPFTMNGEEILDDEIRVSDKKKIVILGGGPNRIGQGIEFDYCCVQAAFAAKELGYEAVMVNSNPETVSTDYDTSDLLFFEPLTMEDVLNLCERLNGKPFGSNDLVRDFTGASENPKPITTTGINLTNLEFSVPREVSSAVKAEIHKKNTGPLAIVWQLLSPADPSKTCNIYYFLDRSNDLWTMGFNALQPCSPTFELIRVDDQSDIDFVLPKIGKQRLDDAAVWLKDASSSGHVHGVIVQFGGQTPLNLANGLRAAGVPIIGTSVDSIDLTEDRDKFKALCDELNVRQPANGIAYDVDQAVEIANEIGYPVLVRPSFVLGGRAMETVFDDEQLRKYMVIAIGASDLEGQPILIDKFLAEATECDIDVIADYGPVTPGGSASDDQRAIVCGVLEHIEEAGIHSGDSACSIPPYSLPADVIAELKDRSRAMARALDVRGLMNVQWAIRHAQDGNGYEIYVIEVNPRASRTVPFVGKATGVQWAKLAAKVMAGQQLSELGVIEEVIPTHTSVKESVFPFSKFPGVDVVLGPEMRSTGEVMGADADFGIAFAKAQMGAGQVLPTEGKVFISFRKNDKNHAVGIASELTELGYELCATDGTHKHLKEHGIASTRLNKIKEGRPNAIDLIKNNEIAMIINTPTRKGAGTDEGKLRATAVRFGVPMITTATGGVAAAHAMRAIRQGVWDVHALQDYAKKIETVTT
ncbi:MAG: carbamoyl-phosphate synthase large subunit, partial [Planctomycetota bacterium]